MHGNSHQQLRIHAILPSRIIKSLAVLSQPPQLGGRHPGLSGILLPILASRIFSLEKLPHFRAGRGNRHIRIHLGRKRHPQLAGAGQGKLGGTPPGVAHHGQGLPAAGRRGRRNQGGQSGNVVAEPLPHALRKKNAGGRVRIHGIYGNHGRERNRLAQHILPAQRLLLPFTQ